MLHSGANIELAWLAARYEPCLIEAGIWANQILRGDSFERRHNFWRRYPLLQGQFRRICVIDSLSAAFSLVNTAAIRTIGNLWLLVLHDWICWHVKKFPLASIDDLNGPLPEPKTVQRAKSRKLAGFDESNVANRQLAFSDLGFKSVVMPIKPPLFLMRPIGLWYEVFQGLIVAWHLIEQSENDIIAKETIIVPFDPDSTSHLPGLPPTPPIDPKYNDPEGDPETA